jgi:hypothetical protein
LIILLSLVVLVELLEIILAVVVAELVVYAQQFLLLAVGVL